MSRHPARLPQLAYDTSREVSDLRFSLGMLLQKDGTLQDVLPGAPAAQAGLGPGLRLVAVNGRKWSRDVLHDALRLGVTASEPLALLVTNGEFYETHTVDYHGGERCPHLERDASRPDVLSAIIGPVTKRP